MPINTPETEIFKKSEVFYGYNVAKIAIRRLNFAIIVEGQMDMISSYGAGVTETVAVGGTALTEDQIEMLARLGKTIYLSLDADEAGIAAIKRAVEIAEKRGLEIKVVQIEGGKDPDEIARNSPGKWNEMVDNAVDVYEFVMSRSLEKNDIATVTGIKKVTEDVVPLLVKIENGVVREVWTKKLAEKLGVDSSVVKSEIERVKSGRVSFDKFPAKNVQTPEPIDNKMEKLGKRLVGGLLICPGARPKIRSWVRGVNLPGAVGKALTLVLDSEGSDPTKLVETAPAELRGLIEDAYMAEGEGETEEKDVLGLAVQLLREIIREKRKTLIEELKEGKNGGEEGKEEELSKELNDLDREENKIMMLLE